jgi:photosystem II stability/assembly factor-like uncharacterized protein
MPAVLFLLLSCSTAVPPKPLPDPLGNGAAREQWLFDQRAYPFGEIPADARRKALDEARQRERFRPAAENTSFTPYWRPIGPLPVNTAWPWKTATGRVKALAISPEDPNIVLAGSSSGGIWRSTDGGDTFAPVSDHHADLSVGAIAFAPSNPRTVYAVSGSDFLGTGVLKSADAGATWQVVDGPSFAPRGTANRMAVDPHNADRLWVAQTSRQDASTGSLFSSGLLRSTDGGFSWTTTVRAIVSDFAAAPGSAATFLLGIPRHDGGGTAGVHRSTDGGATSTLVFPGKGTLPRFTFAYSRTTPSRVYLHSFMENTPALHVSNDGGVTWSDVAATLPSSRPSFLVAHPSKEELFLGYPGGDLHVSADGGVTWRNITMSRNAAGRFDPQFSLTHIDQHALVFAPHDDRVLYLGNDGGIYKSIDGGATFTSLADSLSLVQAYGIAAHPRDPEMLFLGTQDNGLERKRNGRWHELITGDYGSILFEPNDPSNIVSNYVYGTILSFSANGDRFVAERATEVTFGELFEPYRIQFIAPFEQQRMTGTLFFGTWKLFASIDFGRSWTARAGSLDFTRGGTDTLSAIGLAPNDPATIYTGSAAGRLMRSRDEGETWTDITGALPQRHVKAIAVDPEDAGRVWLAFSGYRAAHVYRTTDYGDTWTAVSSGLPDVPVNALFIDPSNREVVYAGTDIGVFVLNGTQWHFFNDGMPPVVVTAFDVTAGGRIVAATYGRGAYELVTEPSPRRRSVRH